MKKKKQGKNSKRKKMVLITILIGILLALFISTIYNSMNVKSKKNNSGVEVMELKEFIDVSLNEVINKVNNKEDFVLYIGYPGCQACETYSPTLKRVQTQRDDETYYLNYKSVNKKDKNWKSLNDKIKIEQKLVVSIDGKETTIEDSIGNIILKYGYTPVTIIFEKGKCINAYIGSMGARKLETMLNN